MPVDQEIQEIRDRDDIESIRERLEGHENAYMSGIGYRFEDDERTDEPAILVYVEEKVPGDDLGDEERIPGSVEGITVDVREKPRPSEEQAPIRENERVRPILGGTRQSRDGDDLQGSIGGGFIDADGEKVYLTNAHVVHEDEDGVDEVIGKPIYQAKSNDEESDDNVIGEVKDLEYDQLDDSEQDWATISIDDDEWFTNQILGVGKIGEYREPSFKDVIVFTGASPSGDSYGLRLTRLEAVDVYASGRGPSYEYMNVTGGGDSGSIAGTISPYTGTFHPFALHFLSGSYGLDIATVYDRAGLERDGNNYSTSVPDLDPYFEGTIVAEYPSESVLTLVTNVGGSKGSTMVELLTENGGLLDSEAVDLDPLETEWVALDASEESTVVLDTGDLEEEIDLGIGDLDVPKVEAASGDGFADAKVLAYDGWGWTPVDDVKASDGAEWDSVAE